MSQDEDEIDFWRYSVALFFFLISLQIFSNVQDVQESIIKYPPAETMQKLDSLIIKIDYIYQQKLDIEKQE